VQDITITKQHRYTDKATDLTVMYIVVIDALVAGNSQTPVMQWRPARQAQTTVYGIDRLDLKIPRAYVNEAQAWKRANAYLGIRKVGKWMRISINRELLAHTGSYRSTVVDVLYRLFVEGVLVLPLTRRRDDGPVQTINKPVMDDKEAFRAIIDQVTLERIEVFFDHNQEILQTGAMAENFRHVSDTLYSADFKKTMWPAFRIPSFIKVYDKVKSQTDQKKRVETYEAKNPHRFEFTLTKGTKNFVTWKALDCTNEELIDLLEEDIANRLSPYREDLRKLLEIEAVQPRLRELINLPGKQRLKFSRAVQERRRTGQTSVDQEIDRVFNNQGQHIVGELGSVAENRPTVNKTFIVIKGTVGLASPINTSPRPTIPYCNSGLQVPKASCGYLQKVHTDVRDG